MHRSNYYYLIVLFLVSISQNSHAQSFDTQFQQVLDSVYNANEDAVGIMVAVESNSNKLSWTQAVGFSDKGKNEKLNIDQPALIASNTKTFVAVAILRLVENGQLNLADSIANLIKLSTLEALANAGYNADEISVKHLLSHTSGIVDYVDSNYFNIVDEKPWYKWTRDEQIERSMKMGRPLADPGEQFTYGDINYLLLSEILETKTGLPFYLAIRELVGYERQGLYSTWFIQLEEHPKGVPPLVHQYWAKRDWDSFQMNPSWDLYGGGGLVASVNDLALFFQKLFNGEIINDPKLLAQVYSYVLPVEQSNYCLGIRRISFHGFTGYYHGGFWGTDVMYIPEHDLTIAIFTLQKDSRDLNADLSFQLLKCIANNKKD